MKPNSYEYAKIFWETSLGGKKKGDGVLSEYSLSNLVRTWA